jgi:protein AFG1
MDLFYDSLPDAVSKRRIHFHAFMMDVHQRAHRLKADGFHGSDGIVPIARQLARDGRILCFDEFQARALAPP